MATDQLTRDQNSLHTAVQVGTLAPSVHNSQPWRFVVGTASIDIYADRDRWLKAVDPSGRELMISCGGAIRYTRAALRSEGLAETTTLLPDVGDPNHVARIVIGPHRIASEAERELAEAIFIRYTDRERFSDREIPAALIEEFRRGVEVEGAWIRPIVAHRDEVATAVLLAHADEVEVADAVYREELADWSREDEQAIDGIPRSAVSSTRVVDRRTNYRLRDFDVARSAAARPDGTLPPPVEHPLVVVLGTPTDDPYSWLEAGQALAWLLARAAAEGVTSSPMTQVLEIPSTRMRLKAELRMVGYPQMLLRMGYGTGSPKTHRRPAADVLGMPNQLR